MAHIVEDPQGIANLADVECPTDYYYECFEKWLWKKFPKASPEIIEHMISLCAFLDVSILSGFSYGSAKAVVCVKEGKVLGRIVTRTGATCEPERVNAIVDFSPLENPNHIRQFLGCTNWIRWFLAPYYHAASKTLTDYLRPGAEFPEGGLGKVGGKTPGDNAVVAMKLMCKDHIESAVMDEVGALSGKLPLEQIADSCGYA